MWQIFVALFGRILSEYLLTDFFLNQLVSKTVATTALWCMFVRHDIRPYGFVWTITSVFIDGFQNNLAQLFS